MVFVDSLQEIWKGRQFAGEVILAGGAFKPLLSPTAAWNDIDLWVPDEPTRTRLDAHLGGAGFHLISDLRPFCRAYRDARTTIEITYHDLKKSATERVFRDFDLSPSRIAARIKNGKVVDFAAGEDFWECLDDRTVRVSEAYLRAVRERHSPDILLGIHRLQAWAHNLGWLGHPVQVNELWEEFASRYPPQARENAIRLAWKILVNHKNCPESPIWARVAEMRDAATIVQELAANSP